jgi:hypothetical protein
MFIVIANWLPFLDAEIRNWYRQHGSLLKKEETVDVVLWYGDLDRVKNYIIAPKIIKHPKSNDYCYVVGKLKT